MRKVLSEGAIAAMGVVVALPLFSCASAPSRAQEVHAPSAIAIPESIRTEHQAIHSALVEATKAPGDVGAAARALAEVLHPHFVREEEIALPPLGLLAPLASGASVAEEQAEAVLAMSDALRREMPRMLEEHRAIRAAVEGLRRAAIAERSAEARDLTEQLALHARTEEEVLYPAAMLVGDLLRARRSDR